MWKRSNEIAFAFMAIVLLLASSGSGIFWYRSNYAPLYDPPRMLKSGIFAAQVRSQQVPQADADGDDTGEFVLLLDLKDHDIIERMSIESDGETAQYNGYYYRIYLPKSATEGATQASQVDVNLAETYWIAYAQQVIDILKKFTAAGGTVLMSSHSMHLIQRICDHVAIIADGRMLASGTLEEVLQGQSLEDRFVELAGGATAVEGMEWLHSYSD
jgi:hypothetical protein